MEFKTDAKMTRTLEALRKHYDLADAAAVIQRAVALLKIASRLEDAQGDITFVQNERMTKVTR